MKKSEVNHDRWFQRRAIEKLEDGLDRQKNALEYVFPILFMRRPG